MVELRDYQRILLHRVEAALDADAKARVMMQLPTGGGKTEIAGQLLKRRLTDGRKAVWMTHRRELTEQSCDRLTRAGVTARVETTWKPNNPDAPAVPDGVAILMAQTLGRRNVKGNVWSKYGPNDLMVIDEAHHAPAAGWERSMKQWPGRVLGMTATPWRLTKKEGFDHLFDNLICGPQIVELQRNDNLCKAKVKMPTVEDRIRGGDPVWDGDYNPGGIEQANSDRPEVMTARALKFWQEHARDRQTIVYAVSVGHARILKELFKEEGIRAGIVLGATNQDQTERNRVIKEFEDRSLKVLINVVIVTEGFDLPYASCIVMARPTLSLALFMQMVGRGLRPKSDGGDCLILDLADNTTRHGLPEKNREWSLEPRGSQSSGEAPTVWCVKCDGVSHAASHHCAHCENPLGEDCNRCHRWRALKRWQYKENCGDAHDLVCDFCHNDAHERAYLPSIPTLYELDPYQYNGESEQPVTANDKIDLELAEPMRDLFGKFLDRELRRAIEFDEGRQEEFRRSIRGREHMLGSSEVLSKEFSKHYWRLKEENRPEGEEEITRAYYEWQENLKTELVSWKKNIEEWNNREINKYSVFQDARYKMGRFLSLVAQDEKFLPEDPVPVIPVTVDGTWHLLGSSLESTTKLTPSSLRTPDGFEIYLPFQSRWKHILIEVAEWLIRKERLTLEQVPIRWGARRYLVHTKPEHGDGKPFKDEKKLSNGLYLEIPSGSERICKAVEQLKLANPAHEQFYVRYELTVDYNLLAKEKPFCDHSHPELCNHPR